MRRNRPWNIAAPHEAAEALAARLRVSPLIAQILLNRGVMEYEACQDFLRPSLKCLHDPFSIRDLNRASQRIAKAIRDREKVVIYGDYDVDGITATAILWHAIRNLGGVVEYYIPHRIDEGYGLNAEAIAQICDAGARLIVTVDCGVTAIEPAAIARERGVDLIITDHHEWRVQSLEFRAQSLLEETTSSLNSGSHGSASAFSDAESASDSSPNSELQTPNSPLLPDCHSIVHPRLPGDGPAYPNPHLCGAGVAFKLAWGIGLAMSGANRVDPGFREFLLNATALAALGTIADVVPLVGENRILAFFGLGGLKASKLSGLQALIASAGLTGQNLDSFHVGFLLGPRLNACGRMGHAERAVEMLTKADAETAQKIADELEQQNRARQAVEKQIFAQAVEQVVSNKWDDEANPALVLGSEGWHAGVIGIVASRIVERFYRPTIMVALDNGHGQGSGRSVSGFHLAHALDACGEFLESHGGHEMAAGLRLETARLDDFRQAFAAHADSVLEPAMRSPRLEIDCLAELRELSPALITELDRLGPFGQSNRRPLMACRDLMVLPTPRRVGKTGDHLQFHVRQGNCVLKCIAFGCGDLFDRLTGGTRVDLAFEPSLNEYNGYTNVQLEVKDFQFPQ